MKKFLAHFKNTTEVVVLLFMFMISVYFFAGSFYVRLDARMFPMLTALFNMICIVIYVLKQLRKDVSEKDSSRKKEKTENSEEPGKKVALTIVCFFGFIIVAYLFGFLVAAVLTSIGFPLIFKHRRIPAIIGCFIFNVGVILVFQKALGMPMSRGILLDLSFLFW